MKNFSWIFGIISVVALVISIASYTANNGSVALGGYSNYDDLELNGSGTTTILFNGPTSGKGGCIQLKNQNGDTVKVYVAGTATTSLTVAAGTCK